MYGDKLGVALRCYIVMSNCPSICYIVAMF
jgi:hypothetical protein